MRVAIVGNSGSGKTTLARRVHERTGWPHVELDALFHQPGWTPQERERFRADVAASTEGADWVCDGNYEGLAGDLVRATADVIVVFDLPRHRVMRQIIARTLSRVIRREQLWNGNREPWSNLTTWDPETNIMRWAWVHHSRYRRQFRARIEDGSWRHAQVVLLRSHTDGDRWLATLPVA